MPALQQEHPQSHVLTAFIQGRLSKDLMAEVESHVADCSRCCDFLSRIPEDELAVLARETHEAAAPTVLFQQADTDTTGKQVAAKPERLTVPRELAEHPRYRVQQVIGKGGMGVVYKAEHRMMQRPVALKVINERFTRNSEAIERFHQEVRAAAKLNHPNIVAAFDAEQAGNLHFLVMEYVEGKSLAEWVQQRGPLSVIQACNAIRQVCQGLQHAHDRGMIHRDIKPQNLMLAKSGKIKILDFGLARFEREQIAVSPTAPTESELTAFGTVLGTPDYMAPEQATDARLADNRADIFSLGCTLFFLLTGRSPFQAGSFTALINSGIDREMLELSSLRHDLPRELVAIFTRMTAIKPADRFSTVAEIALALTPFGRGEKFETAESGQSTDSRAADDIGTADLQGLMDADEDESSIQRPQTRSRSVSRHRSAETETFDTAESDLEDVAAEAPPSRRRSRSRRPVRPTFQVQVERLLRRWWRHAAGIIGILILLSFAYQGLTSGPSEASKNLSSESVPIVAATGSSPAKSESSVRLATQAQAPDRSVLKPAQAVGGNVLMVLPAWNFWWPDYDPARRQLEAAGVNVSVASWQRTAQPLADGGGSTVTVDLQLNQVTATNFDALMICGGPGVTSMVNPSPENGETVRIVKDMLASKRIVSAVCMGPIVLAKAGVIEGIPITGSKYIRDKCWSQFGITLTDNAVEQHGNIITGRDADVIPEFTQALIAALAKRN